MIVHRITGMQSAIPVPIHHLNEALPPEIALVFLCFCCIWERNGEIAAMADIQRNRKSILLARNRFNSREEGQEGIVVLQCQNGQILAHKFAHSADGKKYEMQRNFYGLNLAEIKSETANIRARSTSGVDVHLIVALIPKRRHGLEYPIVSCKGALIAKD
uniref:Uncharacterized protein n=1 Tax=Strigamia maritima TaxID=126957 RepID=T1J629_STRMM